MRLLSIFAVLMCIAVPIQFTTCAESLPFLTAKESKMNGAKLRQIESAVGKHIDQKNWQAPSLLYCAKEASYIWKPMDGAIWHHELP